VPASGAFSISLDAHYVIKVSITDQSVVTPVVTSTKYFCGHFIGTVSRDAGSNLSWRIRHNFLQTPIFGSGTSSVIPPQQFHGSQLTYRLDTPPFGLVGQTTSYFPPFPWYAVGNVATNEGVLAVVVTASLAIPFVDAQPPGGDYSQQSQQKPGA